MPKAEVAILMSTYNGEKYLEEQVRSIINQDYENWHLYIRDDGSKDNTVNLIKNFVKYNSKISLLDESNSENLGITESFMRLLARVNADYYMFSDQDDYWEKDKISATLTKMQLSEKNNLPICVHTDLTIVNANLKGNTLLNGPDYSWSSFRRLLFANCVTGCTMMINQSLKNLIDFNNQQIKNIYLHDWWIALIAAAFGKVVYLNRSTILYRQHENNVVGSNNKGTAFYNKLPANERVIQTVRMAKDFWHVYKKRLRGRDRVYTQEYASLAFHQNPLWNLYVVLKCPPVRPKIKGDLFFGYQAVKNYRILSKLGR